MDFNGFAIDVGNVTFYCRVLLNLIHRIERPLNRKANYLNRNLKICLVHILIPNQK